MRPTYDELLKKVKHQKEKLIQLNQALDTKNKVINHLTYDLEFMRKRITQLHGRDFLKTILNCSENRQFDVIGFDEGTKRLQDKK